MKATLQTTYLYADGHAVQVFKKKDRDAGWIEFAEVTERFTKARIGFTGRLVIGPYSSGLVGLLAKTATHIEVTVPKLLEGADKSHGIPVGVMQVSTKDGALYFYDIPGFIAGEYKYQPDDACANVFDANATQWGDLRVARIHRVKAAAEATA